MRKILLLSFSILAITADIFGQYYTNQNKVWAFGNQGGLDFNSGVPVPIQTGMDAGEGCASVSDTFGHLLFYTNGKTVYNHLHDTMPNGTSIVSFDISSAEQAALIIPVIGIPNKYYIFSLEASNTVGSNHLAYSIVDMTLDGGLGDIVTSSMGIPLETSLGENMVAVAGNHNNIWLLTHRRDTSIFLAYNITEAGISSPVLSTIGTLNGAACYNWSMLRVSPIGVKVVQAIYHFSHGYGSNLFDFNPSTGVISNSMVVDTFDGVYGAEFSPDNTKLYLYNWTHKVITQHDLSLSSDSAIRESRIIVADSVNAADLKLAPDGKIYFRNSNPYMGSINAPNLAGVSCGFTPHAITLVPGTSAYGLPNLFVTADAHILLNASNSKNSSSIKIFPNPASTTLTIISKNPIIDIEINSVVGQLVFKHAYNDERILIDIIDIPKGIYFIKINGTEVRKFIKQ